MLLFSYIKVSADEIKDERESIEIEADSMDYDYNLDKYHAKGKVVINYSDIVLNADDVELDARVQGDEIADLSAHVAAVGDLALEDGGR